MDMKKIPWGEIVQEATPQLFHLGREMISSWAQKPGEQTNASWLAGEMGKHIGMSAEEANDFGDKVMGGIDRFNATLDAADRACQQGGTKEAWLAKRLEELPADDMAARGAYLEEMRNGLNVGNAAAYHAMETGVLVGDYPELPPGAGEPWSKAQVKGFAREIGQQATLAGSIGAAMDIEIPEGLGGQADRPRRHGDSGRYARFCYRCGDEGGCGRCVEDCIAQGDDAEDAAGDTNPRAHHHCLLGYGKYPHSRSVGASADQSLAGCRTHGTCQLRCNRKSGGRVGNGQDLCTASRRCSRGSGGQCRPC